MNRNRGPTVVARLSGVREDTPKTLNPKHRVVSGQTAVIAAGPGAAILNPTQSVRIPSSPNFSPRSCSSFFEIVDVPPVLGGVSYISLTPYTSSGRRMKHK